MKRFKTISARLVLAVITISMLFSAFGMVSAFAEGKIKTTDDGINYYESYTDWAEDNHHTEESALDMSTDLGISENKGESDTNKLNKNVTYVLNNGKYYPEGVVSSAVTNYGVGKLDVDVKADVGSANDLVSGFEPVINLVIGILAWLIVIGLPLITAIDVAYITIPFFREKNEEIRASGNKAMTKTGKDGSTKLRWISDEAQHAVETTDLENGKSPLKIYLTHRIGAFVMVAIILYLLIGGQITVVTQLAVRLVSGIMSILGGLGN